MTSPARFDRIHGKGAFLRLCSMIADPAFAYEHIGGKFGLTRQRIAHVATELGVDGRQRRHERNARADRTSSDSSKNTRQLFKQSWISSGEPGFRWLRITYRSQALQTVLGLR